MFPRYENVNLTQPVLRGLRDAMKVFLEAPDTKGIPAGSLTLVNSMIERAEELWSEKWKTRLFSQHEIDLPMLVSSVTHATAAHELLVALRDRLLYSKRWPMQSLDERVRLTATELHKSESSLFILVESMVAELGRTVRQGEDSSSYLSYEIDEIFMKRLSYAYHLAGLSLSLADNYKSGFDDEVVARCRDSIKRVAEPYRKELYSSADFISGLGLLYPIKGDLQGKMGTVKSSTRFFTMSPRQRRALAVEIDQTLLRAA